MARSPRNLDELKTSIEESMAEALGQGGRQDAEPGSPATLFAEPESPAPAVGTVDPSEPRTEPDRLVEACQTAAADIQATGEAVVNVANSIAAETRALAELLRKHGAAIAARMEEFAAMSKRVADKVNAAREEVLSTTGPAPSLAPRSERDDAN
jgi:hypothetical protein